MKRLVCLILGLALLFPAAGCSAELQSKRLEIKALKYLNEKYDDTFTFVDWVGMPDTYVNMEVSSKKYDDIFLVEVVEKNDSITFRDDYFKLYMYDDAMKYFSDIVKQWNNNAVLYVAFNQDYLSVVAPKDMEFKEALKNSELYFGLYVVTDCPLTKETELLLLQEFEKRNTQGCVNFWKAKDLDAVKKLSLNDLISTDFDKYEVMSYYDIGE